MVCFEMKASEERAERARNHVLRDNVDELGGDKTKHVLLGQIKDFVLWRLKLVNDIIRFTQKKKYICIHIFFLKDLSATISRIDYR